MAMPPMSMTAVEDSFEKIQTMDLYRLLVPPIMMPSSQQTLAEMLRTFELCVKGIAELEPIQGLESRTDTRGREAYEALKKLRTYKDRMHEYVSSI